jgi:hypothetical protein
MTTYTAITPTGRIVTRKSDAAYTHAAVKRSGHVTFHKSHTAAHRAAGSFGVVVPVTSQVTATDHTCIVCNGTRQFTEQRADGTMVTSPCWKCSR